MCQIGFSPVSDKINWEYPSRSTCSTRLTGSFMNKGHDCFSQIPVSHKLILKRMENIPYLDPHYVLGQKLFHCHFSAFPTNLEWCSSIATSSNHVSYTDLIVRSSRNDSILLFFFFFGGYVSSTGANVSLAKPSFITMVSAGALSSFTSAASVTFFQVLLSDIPY